MENSNKIIPPHLNAEVYRTDTTGACSISYLDYIRLHPDDGILIGCSELTGRYWNGGANLYKSVTEAQRSHSNEKRAISLTSGTADGCFVGNPSKVLLCEDSGAISIWTVSHNDSWKQWSEEKSVAEHDDSVLAVDCLQSEKEYVTAGADGNIKVWDINEMICIRNYLAAHSLAIHGVVVRPSSSACFATGSLDYSVTLWDENVSQPVLDLAKNSCGVRCLQWTDENSLIYGDEAGVMYLVDARKPETTIKLCEFPAAIHKLVVHTEAHKVAVCCDNKIVSVCELNENATQKVIYHDRHMHTNYVRDAAWDLMESKTLHTVGWDGEIKSHNITWDCE
ncbi:methylosome protein WDR77-like [Ostrinia nubilalis]|uniref:methylosome protein WDR77-like n=1 Tax=Ostrinia nubilalis TaxID=29057 RepID=UPI0030823DE5